MDDATFDGLAPPAPAPTLSGMERSAIEMEHDRAQFVRELHDAITHAVSQIHMHAAALQTVGAARGAASVEAIRVACGAAMHDLRRMHAAIQDGSPAPYRPQPTLATLQELIDALRAAGTTVAFVLGDCSVPPSTAAGAHRIVCEVLGALQSMPQPVLASIDVYETGGHLELGLTLSPGAPGLGGPPLDLARARARARLLGGELTLVEHPGAPRRIDVTLPLEVLA